MNVINRRPPQRLNSRPVDSLFLRWSLVLFGTSCLGLGMLTLSLIQSFFN